MERKKPCTAGTAYCSMIMRSFSSSNAGLCTSMGILPQAATAANGPALHLVSREKVSHSSFATLLRSDHWPKDSRQRSMAPNKPNTRIVSRRMDRLCSVPTPRLSGEPASPNISNRIAKSSSAHISISSDPPLTSAKSPIARRTFSTTPGFDSGSLSFGTKILRIGFMYVDIRRGVLITKWSNIRALCSLFRLMPECSNSVNNCTITFLNFGITVINKALNDSGCANSASNVSSNERRIRTLTLQSMSVMATISKRSMTCDTVSIKVAEFSMVSAVLTASFNKCVQVPKVRRANTMVGISCGKFIELSIGELTGNIPA
uniref:Uncharacterized protein n=1 Tax=Glossina austeni TaxID=7395 RepID=A0A1A9UKR5_GLOAU